MDFEINPIINYPINPFEYQRKVTEPVLNIGGNNVPVIVADIKNFKNFTPESLSVVGYFYDSLTDKWNISDQACDYVYVSNDDIDFEIPGTLGIITRYEIWKKNPNKERFYPIFSIEEYLKSDNRSSILNFVRLNAYQNIVELTGGIDNDKTIVLVVDSLHPYKMATIRKIFADLINKHWKMPVILNPFIEYQDDSLNFVIDCGGLLLDGLGDGLFMSQIDYEFDYNKANSTVFGILQATRTRISKTEYISCPSCGRTLFDLQETTAKIRSRTDHLKGVKIAIMGCIVNGPGEMADADYGYVGTGVGKITLYRGKNVVLKSIDAVDAVDALINLIKEDRIWIEKDV
jgi:(E)-4-hydroxy-3-methylbut-2-enyl-diphosphate synthase